MSKLDPQLQYDLERFIRGEQPTLDELKAAPWLKNWHVVTTREFDTSTSLSLRGIVTGHQSIANGETTTTSELMWLDAGRGWARTRSRIYALMDEVVEAYTKEGG
jgi:hypothetical protein